jgi:hypothetical protein
MLKISRSMRNVLIAVVAIGAILYYFTEPDDTQTGPSIRPTSVAPAAPLPSDILPEDLNARFPRYKGGTRDPFVPALLRNGPDDLFGDGGAAGGKGTWALTGINVVNGAVSALVENATTGESVFLSQGDQWRGLKVVGILSDAVIFENALGQQTRLAFELPEDEQDTSQNSTSGNAVLPPLGSIPPMPINGNIQALPNFPPAAPEGR